MAGIGAAAILAAAAWLIVYCATTGSTATNTVPDRARGPSDRGPARLPNEPQQAEIVALKQQALAVVRKLLRQFPGDPQAIAVAAQLQYRLGNSTKAMELWEESLRVAPGWEEPFAAMAAIARQRGQYEEAERYARKRLACNPRSAAGQIALAEILLDAGKVRQAVELLEQPLSRHGHLSQSEALIVAGRSILLGQAYLQLKRYEEARKSFAAALKLAPKYPHAHFGMATACARLGLRKEAEKHRREFANLRGEVRSAYPDPGGTRRDLRSMRLCVAQTHTAAADVYLQHAGVVEAERHLQRACEVFPAHKPARERLLAIYRQTGHLAEALAQVAELRKLEPHNLRWLLTEGSLHVQAGRFDAAETAFRTAVEQAPDEAAGYNALARLYLRADRNLQEAGNLAARAVELDPVAINYYVLALVCRRIGKDSQAAAAARKAVELEPDNPEYRRLCGELLDVQHAGDEPAPSPARPRAAPNQ